MGHQQTGSPASDGECEPLLITDSLYESSATRFQTSVAAIDFAPLGDLDGRTDEAD
jgi:hypothetical protein